MTTELEEQFYKTFGIEKRYIILEDDYGQYRTHEKLYPKITPEKLLEMICINSQKGGIEIFNRKNIEELKNSIIRHCIDRLGYALNKEQYKTKIQQLFKEEE